MSLGRSSLTLRIPWMMLESWLTLGVKKYVTPSSARLASSAGKGLVNHEAMLRIQRDLRIVWDWITDDDLCSGVIGNVANTDRQHSDATSDRHVRLRNRVQWDDVRLPVSDHNSHVLDELTVTPTPCAIGIEDLQTHATQCFLRVRALKGAILEFTDGFNDILFRCKP